MTDIPKDKRTEAEMADYLGITLRALRTRRHRNQIPYGVWNKQGRDTIYSVRRYEEWLESTWDSPQESSLSEKRSESGSPGKGQRQIDDAKPSTSRKRRRASQPQQRYVIKLPA